MQSEGAEKSFRMKQNERFMSRLMAKETSVANSSARVFYYREESVGVPFMWESQPGTPKHHLSHHPYLPPLTPPPSYYSNSRSSTKQRNPKLRYIFSSILPRFAGSRKAHVSPSSSSRSSSSSSSSSSSWSILYSSPSYSVRRKDKSDLSFPRPRSLPSTPAIPVKHYKGSNEFGGCYSVKNAVLNFLGHSPV